MNNPESQMQQACILWFAYAHSKLWQNKRLHSVPNGGLRSKKTAGILKAEGAQAGVWDLHLTVPRGQYAGLWIESKAGKNGLTDEQKAFRVAHEGLYQFAVVRTVEEFIGAITDYLKLSI